MNKISSMVLMATLYLMPVHVIAAPQVVVLHQTACQFIAAEGGDKNFAATSFTDCEKLNDRTATARLAQQHVRVLTAGEYVFRVYNDDVPYELGFWLRGQGVGRLTLPSVSGGGIQIGGYKDYSIHLKAGEYDYSCPLNPTPDYTLRVIDKQEK